MIYNSLLWLSLKFIQVPKTPACLGTAIEFSLGIEMHILWLEELVLCFVWAF